MSSRKAFLRAALARRWAILALAALQPALALKWERIGSVPINGFIADSASSPPKLAMWRTESEALGLLALQEPTPQQLLTTNGGRTWTRISNHFVSSVYMVSNNTAFATGQLATQRNGANPDAVLKWTRTGNKWSMSLTPPSGVGIAVTQVEATDGGKTVFLLGYLLFKDKRGAPSLSRATDGARIQYVWRYRAATDKWDVVHTVKSTVVAQSNPRSEDIWSQTMVSISASSGSALYASWGGLLANGASAAGRITFFNGTAWSNFRAAPTTPDAVRQLKGIGGQVFAAISPPTTSDQQPTLQHRNGTRWVTKLTSSFQQAFFSPVAAPTASFALVAEGGITQEGAKAARLWRWNGATATFSKVWDITGTGSLGDVVLDAYSDKRAVAVGVFNLRRIVARRWFNNKWETINTLTCAANVVCAVSDLVALPGGSALLTLVGSGGVYRLV